MVSDLVLTFSIDKVLRFLLPAKVPPNKGHEVYKQQYIKMEKEA